ncbi:MAG: hypothetical protein JNL96_08795 [Planctomycetaceae bacterium]|nr:hypothetical protein [Planctomycetaceae bacterium]
MHGSFVSRRLFGRCVLIAVVGAAGLLATSSAEAGQCGPDITGCWPCGSWTSHCTGHQGKLRATITCCDGSHYKCTFSGTFFKVIPFRYTVTLCVTRVDNGVVYFTASRNIPLFGGTYSMNGYATACKFHANYCSPKDRGTFSMSR